MGIQKRISEYSKIKDPHLALQKMASLNVEDQNIEEPDFLSRKASIMVSPELGKASYLEYALVIEGEAISEILNSTRASFLFLELIPLFKFPIPNIGR